MSTETTPPPKLPPTWFKHAFWRVHRALYRLAGGRVLWTPASKRGWGALGLTAVGHTSGKERTVILGYLDDGPKLVTLAMNGWDHGHPEWWHNVEANPDVVVQVKGEKARPMHAYAASGAERERLWARWREIDKDLDAYAAHHSVETPVVVLEPRA
jgi:deazaflavin-dependent oxidoreductase (nitroreductase family)